MISDQDLRAIAYLAARCRPHGSPHQHWDEQGIIANLRKIAHLNLAEVVLATIRAAMNPAVESPGVLPKFDGEHWRERAQQTITRRGNPTAKTACPAHGGWADNCPGCAADAKAGDLTPTASKPADPDNVAALLADYRARRA